MILNVLYGLSRGVKRGIDIFFSFLVLDNLHSRLIIAMDL